MDAVVERLRRDILDGRYPAQEYLPPERTLAEELGVSRLTLRAALAKLESEGLVRARQGDGVRVLDLGAHATVAVLAHMDLARRPEVVRSFLELRRAVAAEAVALACERASAAAIDALEALAEAQARETDEEAYARRDVEFAREVLRASESFATLLVFNALVPVYEAHPELARALIRDRARSLAGYAATVALLRARDADNARVLVRQALEAVDAEVLAQFAPVPTRKAKGRAAEPMTKRGGRR
ncbi:MAG: GntR family transcriptional regulator [Myxococcota bacterium]